MNSKLLAGYLAAAIIGFGGLAHSHENAAARELPAAGGPRNSPAPHSAASHAVASHSIASHSAVRRVAAQWRAARMKATRSLSAYALMRTARERRMERHSVAVEHKVARLARRFVGQYRYVYGGESPDTGFDCSGLTHYLYERSGHRLPRTAEDQYLATRELPWRKARPGDLVFFHDGDYVYHVAIYEGRNRMVSASDESEGIRFQRIWSSEVTFGTIRP